MSKRNGRYAKNRPKAQTNKLVSRITYNPQKHKNLKVRQMREKLQQREAIKEPPISHPKTQVKFGSFNVNGLDMEVGWAVQQLLQTRGFDVRTYTTVYFNCMYFLYGFLLSLMIFSDLLWLHAIIKNKSYTLFLFYSIDCRPHPSFTYTFHKYIYC